MSDVELSDGDLRTLHDGLLVTINRHGLNRYCTLLTVIPLSHAGLKKLTQSNSNLAL